MPPARAASADRLLAAAGALACLAVLAVAAYLAPDSQGHGTHEQLGMPRCSWVVAFDKPCPTCGMTTSFAHAADGNLAASLLNQPFGALLAIATAASFWVFLHGAVFGSRVGRLFRPLWTPRWIAAGAVLLVAAWGYKLVTWTPATGTHTTGAAATGTLQ